MIMAEQCFVLLDHTKQDTGRAVKPVAASAVRSRLYWPNRILYQKNLQEEQHKICVRKLDRVPGFLNSCRKKLSFTTTVAQKLVGYNGFTQKMEFCNDCCTKIGVLQRKCTKNEVSQRFSL